MREKVPEDFPDFEEVGPAERAAAIRAAEDKAREEVGDAYELVEIGEIASLDRLMNGLDVQDRLDAMIDRCLKRLLFMGGSNRFRAHQFRNLENVILGLRKLRDGLMLCASVVH
jgi:hypothetical protein